MGLNAKLQIVAFVGFLEFYSEIAGTHYMKGGVPGKYPSFAETGFDAVMPVYLYDPAGLWGDMSAEKSKRGLAVEINNGRAAMLGIFGFMAASKVDGSVPALSFQALRGRLHAALRGELRPVRVGGTPST